MDKIYLTSPSIHKIINFINREIGLTDGKQVVVRFKKASYTNDLYVFRIKSSNGKEIDLIVDLKYNLFYPNIIKILVEEKNSIVNFLNKNYRNAIIPAIRQYDLDRVIIIEIGANERPIYIIIELFGKGNVILVDKNTGLIIYAHRYISGKKREISKNSKYYPPHNRLIELYELLKKKEGKIKKKDLFRYTPVDPPFLNNIIQENLEEIDIDIASEIEKKIWNHIESSLNDENFYMYNIDNNIYIEPLELENIKIKYVKKGNIEEISDDIFLKLVEKRNQKSLAIEKEIEKLNEKIRKIEEEKRITKDIIDGLYLYINELQLIFEKIRNEEDVTNIKLNDIYIKEINRKERTLSLQKNNHSIKLRYDLNPYHSLSKAYEYVKSLDRAINNLKEEIVKLEQEKEKIHKKINLIRKRPVIKKKWFEKFIWSISTNGFLIVSGRDASSNEILIKKYLDKNDLVFHADIHGSPFTILKKGADASEEDIRDAALITACYSKAWKFGYSTIPVFFVKPEQISKKTPAGLYLKKGSFMIYGKKEYIKDLTLELYLSTININDQPRILIGSLKSIYRNSNYKQVIFKLMQGNMSKYDTARYIITSLIEYNLIEKEMKDLYFNDLLNRLPNGRFRIDKIKKYI